MRYYTILYIYIYRDVYNGNLHGCRVSYLIFPKKTDAPWEDLEEVSFHQALNKYGGFHKWWWPQMDGLYRKIHLEMDDLGVPPFWETSI